MLSVSFGATTQGGNLTLVHLPAFLEMRSPNSSCLSPYLSPSYLLLPLSVSLTYRSLGRMHSHHSDLVPSDGVYKFIAVNHVWIEGESLFRSEE